MRDKYPYIDEDEQLPGEANVPILHRPLTQAEQQQMEERKRYANEKETEDAYKKRQLTLTESSVRLTETNVKVTWILAIFTALGACAAIYQGMVSSRAATASQVAADAAKSAADTAAASLNEQRSNQIASGEQFVTQLSKLDASLRESARLADATNAFAAQAQRSANYAKQSVDMAVDSERPWIGPVLPTDEGEEIFRFYGIKKPIDWLIRFRNYGNSPATHVRWHTRIYVGDIQPRILWGPLQQDIESLDVAQQIEFTLFNGAEGPNSGSANGVLPQTTLDGINRGTIPLILAGRITYSDEFDSPHETTWCIIYNPPRDEHGPGYFDCPIKHKAT